MLQSRLLKTYAPNSLLLLYRPDDTGSPGHDMSEHISRFSAHRIDIEDTLLIGGRVIGHIEQALGPADENELQHRILTIPYAERQLDSNENAVEFVRVIKEAASIDGDVDPRSLQIWASWAYQEIKNGLKTYNESKDVSPAEHKSRVISEVLTKLGRMAMELKAVTATTEDRLAEEPEVYEYFGSSCYSDATDQAERQNLFELRCLEILDKQETTDPFTAELRSVCNKLSRTCASGSVYDEEKQFQEYLGDLIDNGDCDESALQESHDRVTEQYTEGGAISLHMSDSEKFVVDGTLEEDIDGSYLPADAAELDSEIRDMFTAGEDRQTIGGYIEFRLNQIYGHPKDEDSYARHTARIVQTSAIPTRNGPDGICDPRNPKGTRPGLTERTYIVTTYKNKELRQYVREVLEQILANMERDFILQNMNHSAQFRTFIKTIQSAGNVRALIATIQEAYQARLKKSITIKMFTALNIAYEVRRAALESEALLRTERFAPAIPVIALSKTVATKNLRSLAIAVSRLPIEHREHVRQTFRRERPELYARVQNGLHQMIDQAPRRTLSFLRFAFFEDRNTGDSNRPKDMSHLLTSADKTNLWSSLKKASGLPESTRA